MRLENRNLSAMCGSVCGGILRVSIALVFMTCALAHAQVVQQIVQAAGISDGNCLVIDSSGTLCLDMARKSKLRIYLVNPDQKKVDAMRLAIDKAGKYGRITCRVADLKNTFYPTYFFDLVIVNSVTLDMDAFPEIFRVLKPGRAGVFIGNQNVDSLVKQIDVPCAKVTTVEKNGDITVLKKGYEPTNKYLKLPLVRLWAIRTDISGVGADKRLGRKYLQRSIKPGQVAPATLYSGKNGEIVSDRRGTSTRYAGAKRVPLDAYTGSVVPLEDHYEEPVPQLYAKSNANEGTCYPEGDPPPYRYEWMSGHGRKDVPHHGYHVAKDLKTGETVWDFADPFMYHGCCSPFLHVNNVLYKSTYGTFMGLDPHTGKVLWTYRNGGNLCAQVMAARSILFMPTIRSNKDIARFQAFVWEPIAGKAPAGDELRPGAVQIQAPTGPADAHDWPTFHYSALRTGNSPDTSIKPLLKLIWKFAAKGVIDGSPAIADGVVYFGCRDHKVYALDSGTGAVKWVFYADAEVRSSPCVWGSGLFFGCDDGRIYALDKATGKLAWSYRTATSVPRSVYFSGAHASRRASALIEKMKKGDKELLERYSPYRSCTPLTFNGQPLPSPGAVRSSPVVVNGVLYVGTGLGSAATACWGYMYALDALTGKLHWKLTDKDITDHRSEYAVGVNNSPCVYKGRAHFSYGVYTAVDIETGRIAVKGGTVPEKHKFRGWWDRFPPTYTRHDGKAVRYWVDPLLRAHAGVRGGLTVAEEHNLILAVYRTICRPDKVERLVGKKKRQVSPNAIRVFAVDANSGEVQWEGWADQDGWKLFEEPAAIYNGKVYISGGKGIAVFDLKKGSDKKIKLAWVNPIRHKPWSKFIVEPEQVFSGVEGSVMTAPAIANGLIFAGADDGCVYAWDLKSGEVAWKYTTGGKVRSSPAVAKGKLYIGSDDGYVYCFGNK